MRNRMISWILCGAMLAALLAGLPVSASAEGSYTRAELENLLADTAIAYYLKGPDCQYDSYGLSGLTRTKTAIPRQTLGTSPEECSPQKRYYTVCSSFPHDVYFDAFGRHPLTQEDMAVTELPGYSRLESKEGLVAGSRTEEELLLPLSLVSLTSNYCAYGKKVARIGDTDSYESGWIGHDGVAYFWGGNSYEEITDEELAELRDNLRPGDIISVVRGGADDEDGDNSGHTMLFLGEYNGTRYIIHSGGSKYNNGTWEFLGSPYKGKNSGTDRAGIWTVDGTQGGASALGFDLVEHYSKQTRNGTIRINPFEESIGRGKTYGPNHRTGDSVIKQFTVTRPIDRFIGWSGAKESVSDGDLFPKTQVPLTHNALARRQYPGLEITILGDKTEYNDVQAGGTLTYSLIVENDTDLTSLMGRYGTHGTSYSGLKLILPLPENASYLSHTITDTAATPTQSEASYDAVTNTLTADGVCSAVGRTFRVDVTVRISDDALPGDKVTLPHGKLIGADAEAYFVLASLTHTVGGAHPTGFDAVGEDSVTNSGTRTKMDAANDVYAAAGYKLELPDTQSFLNSVLTYAFAPQESSRVMQSRLLDPEEITDPDALLLRRMIVPRYIGGRKLFTPNAAGIKSNRGRLLDFNEDYLQPGDILVYAYTGKASENTARAISTGTAGAERVYVFLGDSNYAYYDDDGAFRIIHAPLRAYRYSSARALGPVAEDFDRNGNTPCTHPRFEYSEVLTQAFRYSYFFCLRPSLAFETLPTMTPSASAAYTVTHADATTGYVSLAGALAAAGAGDTVTLHTDATLTEHATFSGGTLDLGGHTLTTGEFTLTLGAGSATLQNGTVTGGGDAVTLADSAAATIRNMKLFGGTAGAALAASDTAAVTLENVVLASARTDALPVYTASGTQENWAFLNDVTVLVPSALAEYSGNGAALGADVRCYAYTRNAYYQIANAESESTRRVTVFTKDPTARNETKGLSYASFSEALADAGAGDALTLLRDVHTSDLSETGNAGSYGRLTTSSSGRKYAYYFGKSLTVDFGGHTLFVDGKSQTHTTGGYLSGSSVLLTFRNGTIEGRSGWALNTGVKELHLDNMKVYGYADTAIVLSDASQTARSLYAENGTLIAGGLRGISGTIFRNNNAITLRHGSVVVRGGSRIGSITGVAIRPAYNSATAERPNTCRVTVEDGGLFTGRYAYWENSSGESAGEPTGDDAEYEEDGNAVVETGVPYYYYTDYDKTRITASLSFLADSDPVHYLREEHREETIALPGSTTVVAEDFTVKSAGAVSNTTTGVEYASLAAALEAAEAGQTVALNRELSLTADAAIPESVTISLGAHTLTVPAGKTLDARSGRMTADAEGKLTVAGTVRYAAAETDRLPDAQVRMETGGTYGEITAPAGAEFEGKTMIPATDMEKLLSLNLNDTVRINHYLADGGNAYTNESFALVDGERAAVTKEASYWYLPVRDCAAKEMGRESTVQPVGVDSAGAYHLGKPSALSIRGYAAELLGGIDWSDGKQANLGRAMIGMLTYGAAAQRYFAFETEDLADGNLTEADRARMTYTPESISSQRTDRRTTTDPEGIYMASSCVPGSSQALRFYLNLPGSRTDRTELTFLVNYRNYNGSPRTIEKRFAELAETTEDGVFCFEVPGMAAADAATDVTLTVRRQDSIIATVTDSILSYCARVCDTTPDARELADAMLIYGLSARDYFRGPTPTGEENELPFN